MSNPATGDRAAVPFAAGCLGSGTKLTLSSKLMNSL